MERKTKQLKQQKTQFNTQTEKKNSSKNTQNHQKHGNQIAAPLRVNYNEL